MKGTKLTSKDEVRRYLASFFSTKKEVLFALAHGSFAGIGAFRDIDIALYCDPVPESPLQYELDVESALLAEGVIPAEPDVRIMNGAPLAFRYHAVKNPVIILSRDDERWFEFRESTARRYLDFSRRLEPLLREYIDAEISQGQNA